MIDFEGKHAELSVDDPKVLCEVARALSAPTRVDVMCVLGKSSMNVGEIASRLNLPMSTAALAVKVLEEAGLIRSEMQPGQRGAMKICSRRLDSFSVRLEPAWNVSNSSIISLEMPIGGYSKAGSIKTTCGLASEQTYIGEIDNAASFYLPQRFGAQIIWFRQGYLEYDFSLLFMKRIIVNWIEVSFEICSEAPMYRDPWKSDIAVSINGQRLGMWTCPCDCGGRHGKNTPGWWSDSSTQYGFLKTWRVDANGSYLENMPISDVTLASLQLESKDHISVRIEVPADAQNVGGLNLFGEKFGDYTQPIVMRVGYQIKDEPHEQAPSETA
ncbi:MAG TPA: helix-turn-helix domain-containing protein [Candidatus Limiplasma sp.]|nr:helix-turn-helix domain-containing protein [Candidatus Limiplasma sp.]